jgi:hypothetical protein
LDHFKAAGVVRLLEGQDCRSSLAERMFRQSGHRFADKNMRQTMTALGETAADVPSDEAATSK